MFKKFTFIYKKVDVNAVVHNRDRLTVRYENFKVSFKMKNGQLRTLVRCKGENKIAPYSGWPIYKEAQKIYDNHMIDLMLTGENFDTKK